MNMAENGKNEANRAIEEDICRTPGMEEKTRFKYCFLLIRFFLSKDWQKIITKKRTTHHEKP